MHTDLSTSLYAGSLELLRSHPAPAGDTPQDQDRRVAREWVCTRGPEIASLISRMFTTAPDLRHVVDIEPDAILPTVSVTLWCKRTQLFRFDARLSLADTGGQAQVATRLGAGPVLKAENLPFRTCASGEPDLTPEAIVAAFRRSLRFALARDPLTGVRQAVRS